MATASSSNPAEIAAQLRAAVSEGLERFATVDEARTTKRPKPGAWCARQVLGHLIDSACNNHRRFVTGQSASTLVFDGYDGDEWVDTQRYDAVPWRELVALWSAYNHHLAHVIGAAAEEAISRPHSVHNFDRIASRPVSSDEPATLAFLMEDYVFHLRHHLRQIQAALDA